MIDDIFASKALNVNITQAKRKKSFLQMINKADTLIKLKDTQSINRHTSSIFFDLKTEENRKNVYLENR